MPRMTESRGRFAVVRKCRHRASGREFAAKYLRKRRMGKNMRNEILHEVAVLEHASEHSHIVDLFEVYETSQEMILVLELVPGGELYKFCNSELLAEPHMIRVMRQVLQAVEYLHEMHIVHLDLKPSNILLTDESAELTNVKLCDFGISRRISAGIEVRDIVGTPDYVAPEVLNFDPIGTAADMWSVGVLAYVLATGHSPFAGDTKLETIQNISQHSQVDFPDELFEDFENPAPIIDFIGQLLVKDPKQRPTATACLQHIWLQATPSSTTVAVDLTTDSNCSTDFADDMAKSSAVAVDTSSSHHVFDLLSNEKENFNQNLSVSTNDIGCSSSPTKILRTHSPSLSPVTPNISSPRTVRAHSDGQRSPSSAAAASLSNSSATFHIDDEAVEQQRLEATMMLNAQQKARMAAAAMTTVASCPSNLDVPTAAAAAESPTKIDAAVSTAHTLPTPPSSTKTICSSSSCSGSIVATATSKQKVRITSFPATPTKPVVTKSIQIDAEKTLAAHKPAATKRSKSTMSIANSTTRGSDNKSLVVNLFGNKQQTSASKRGVGVSSAAQQLPNDVVRSRNSYAAAVDNESVLPLDVAPQPLQRKRSAELKSPRKTSTSSLTGGASSSCFSPMIIHSMPCSPLRSSTSTSSVLPSLRMGLKTAADKQQQQQTTPTKARKVSKTLLSRASADVSTATTSSSSSSTSSSTVVATTEQRHQQDSDYSSKSSCASSSSPQCNSRADSPSSPPQNDAAAAVQKLMSGNSAVVDAATKPNNSSSASSTSDDSSGIKITNPASSSAAPSASSTSISYRKHNATTTPAVVAVKRATMKSNNDKTALVASSMPPVEPESNHVPSRRQTFGALPSGSSTAFQLNSETQNQSDEFERSQRQPRDRSLGNQFGSPARRSVPDAIKQPSSTISAVSSSLPSCQCIVGSVSSQFGPCLHMRAAAAVAQQQQPPRSSSSSVAPPSFLTTNNSRDEFRRSWAATSNSSPLFFDTESQSNNNDDTICCSDGRKSSGGRGGRLLAQQWLTAVAAARQQQEQAPSPNVIPAASIVRPRTSSCMNTKSDTLLMNRTEQQRRSLYSNSQHRSSTGRTNDEDQHQKSATLPPALTASAVRALGHEIRRVSSTSLHVCDTSASTAAADECCCCCRCTSASRAVSTSEAVLLGETPPPTHLLDHHQRSSRIFSSNGAYCATCSCGERMELNGSKRNSGEFTSYSSSAAAAILHSRQHSHGNDSNSSSGLGLTVAHATPRSSIMLLDKIDDSPEAETTVTRNGGGNVLCCKRCSKKLRKMSNCSLATTLSSSSSTSNTSDLDAAETQRCSAAAFGMPRHSASCMAAVGPPTSQLVMKRCRHFEAAAAASAAGAHAETLRTRRDAANDVVVQLENNSKN